MLSNMGLACTRWRIFVLSCVLTCLVVAVPAHAQEAVTRSVNVTGTVLPQKNNFQVEAVADRTDVVSQYSIITYTITYGSRLAYPEQLTVFAQWGPGTISGSDTPTVNIVNFFGNSATDAYNETRPIVDLVNNSVTWNILSFPANTENRTVSFKLRTNTNYTGDSQVTFPVYVRLMNPTVTTDTVTITTAYKYDRTSVSIPGTTTITPTPSVSPEPRPLTLTGVSVHSISDTEIRLLTETTSNTSLSIKYGTKPTVLNNTLTYIQPKKSGLITIPGLLPSTVYYVQITASKDGQTTTSNIFTIKTAAVPLQPPINPQSIIFTSSDIVLYQPDTSNQQEKHTPVLVIPQGVTYHFFFRINQPQEVTSVRALFTNSKVLGESTYLDINDDTNTDITDLMEMGAGLYQGKLKATALPGEYQLQLQIADTGGNISITPIANIVISAPLQVVNQNTNRPIEGARVVLYRQNIRTRRFEALSPQAISIKNPSYTDTSGLIPIPLPSGTYKAHTSALGYHAAETTFTLGSGSNQSYPTIPLTPEQFSLLSTARYHMGTAGDFLVITQAYLASLSRSSRFFELNALTAAGILVITTFLAFVSKIKIPLLSLAAYFRHVGKPLLLRQQDKKSFYAKIADIQSKQGMPGCNVYLIDDRKQMIIGHTLSDRNGNFTFARLPGNTYHLEVMKPGYEIAIFQETNQEISSGDRRVLEMEPVKKKPLAALLHRTGLVLQTAFSLMFEFLLILSLVFETVLGFTFGFAATTPFLFVSFINVVLWMIHAKHKRNEQVAYL